MKPYEFKGFYHPRVGKFVYKHKGSGIIIDNIFKPMKAIASSVFKKVAKPMAKRALESRISHAGEKIGKKVAEKSGELIMRQMNEGVVFKETVVLRRWGRSIQKFGFINGKISLRSRYLAINVVLMLIQIIFMKLKQNPLKKYKTSNVNICNKKLSSTCEEFKFRLGQETHQILFEFQQTR